MSRNHGAIGAMFGRNEILELPLPVFYDNLNVGLNQGDAAALTFLYGSVAELTGCKSVVVGYDREGWPHAQMNGIAFPHSTVNLGMPFLMNSKMTWDGYVFSDKLLLPRYEDDSLERIKTSKNIAVNRDGFHESSSNDPAVAEQLHRYPSLFAKVFEYLRLSEEEGSLVQAAREAADTFEGGWKVYARRPPSLAQQEVFRHYAVYKYFVRINCSMPTINEIVDQIVGVLPEVEASYQAARAQFSIAA
jgi:hypothetical protein